MRHSIQRNPNIGSPVAKSAKTRAWGGFFESLAQRMTVHSRRMTALALLAALTAFGLGHAGSYSPLPSDESAACAVSQSYSADWIDDVIDIIDDILNGDNGDDAGDPVPPARGG